MRISRNNRNEKQSLAMPRFELSDVDFKTTMFT